MSTLILHFLGTLVITLSLISTIAYGGDFDKDLSENTSYSNINSILRETELSRVARKTELLRVAREIELLRVAREIELLKVARKYKKVLVKNYTKNKLVDFISAKLTCENIPVTKENTNLVHQKIKSMSPEDLIKIFAEIYEEEKYNMPKNKSMSKKSVLIKRFYKEIRMLEDQTTTE